MRTTALAAVFSLLLVLAIDSACAQEPARDTSRIEPTLDLQQLARRVSYPEAARRRNIEGTVVVGALVGVDGRVSRFRIEKSDNELLDEAAIDAVLATTFMPGTVNGTPAELWVSVPIKFQLDR